MQRLVRLKLTSNLPKKTSSFTTTTSSSLFHIQPHKTSSLSKTHTQNHFSTSFPTHPLLNSHSWSTQHTVSQRIRGFLSNPLLRKQVLFDSANTLLRVSSNKLSHCRLAFLQSKFPKQKFQFIPSSHPPSSARSSWFQNVSSNDMVKGLIMANVAVFVLRWYANPIFMYQNFCLSIINIELGYLHTLVTSAITHVNAGDMVSNMIGLYVFGTNIGRVFGPEFLLKMYIAGAVGGSVFYLAHQAFLLQDSPLEGRWRIPKHPATVPVLGAGGAVTAIVLLDILLHPRAKLYFIIPVPAVLLGIFLIGKDIPRIMEGKRGISGYTYLGGTAVAAVAWARLRKGYRIF